MTTSKSDSEKQIRAFFYDKNQLEQPCGWFPYSIQLEAWFQLLYAEGLCDRIEFRIRES